MAENKIIGKILWWNPRDLFGIAKDSFGKRYYMDLSSIQRLSYNPKIGDLVTFEINKKIKDCLCATSVEKLSTTEMTKIKNLIRDLDFEVTNGEV